jgi:hypothetical protein
MVPFCMCFLLAGLSSPPFYTSNDNNDQRGDWLGRLAEDRTKVTLELLGRRIVTDNNNNNNNNNNVKKLRDKTTWASSKKRDVTFVLPELQSTLDLSTSKNNSHPEEDEEAEQVIVGRLYYRPSLFQLFATDVAFPLVRYGHACVESEIFIKNRHTSTASSSRIMDASTGLETLRKDVKYLDRLGKLEYEAAKGYYAMWSDTTIRDKRRDIVDEVEFQSNASLWQRLWRWMRG